jgi:HEAT repeat protein
MGDPRGVSVILETWKTAIPRAEQHEKRRGSMRAWSVWRQGAAEALGLIGGKAEIPFLEEQAKATKDSFVAKACRDAIAAIEKRTAAPPAATPKPAPQPAAPAPAPKPAAPAKP